VRQVTIHFAKTQLSRLIEAAMAGEDVIIARGDTPMVRLVPVVRGGFRLGMLGAALGPGPDFLTPASEEELALWENEPSVLGKTPP
jgi:antitoxin (DNA-binding transcriptional repressor) of toxin-antitoxin stability system